VKLNAILNPYNRLALEQKIRILMQYATFESASFCIHDVLKVHKKLTKGIMAFVDIIVEPNSKMLSNT